MCNIATQSPRFWFHPVYNTMTLDVLYCQYS